MTLEVLAQWDCISLLNRGEYYGNTTIYCDNYACGDECNSFGFSPGPVCDFTGYDLLPSCYNDFGDQVTCDVPPCHEHAGCYSVTTKGSDYRGLASHTENGYRCQPWNDVVEESWDASSYPDTGLEDNFCRNPNDRDRPWCFYVDRDGHTNWTYCAISPCKTTALSEFTRIKNSYNTALPDPPGNNWNSLYFDEHTLDVEEKCALLCLEETEFPCRQFHVALGPGYCEWLEYGEYHFGNPVDYRYDTKGDVFLRKDTYCDGFYRGVTASTCSLPLGMESSWIPDADIQASSYLDEDHAPSFARLHGDSSWIPDPADREPFIQVRFPERMMITGLMIQGGGERDTMFTSLFHLTFSVPGYDRVIFYKRSLYDNSIQFFSGNLESTCVVQVLFERPILTHEIQVWPYVRSGPVALRLEFLGCKDNGCDESITGDSIPAAYLEASSFGQSGDSEGAFHLNPFRRGDTGWIPGPPWRDPNPWLQVTFFWGHNVVGMMSRKCVDETQGFGWLTVLDLEWASSGNTIISQNNSQKLYNLVLNYTGEGSLARLYFKDVIYDTRVVRIIPTEWGGEYQCLSMVLMGCDYNEHSESLDDIDHEQLITDVTCLGCNTNSLSLWRLHHYASDGSSGIAFPTQTEKWVQIQFGRMFIVSGLDTQGGTGLNISFVTDLESHIDEYTLSYQTTFDEDEQGAWRKLVDMGGEPLIFYGLRDPFGVTTSKIDQPFLAVRLRIHLRQREYVYWGRVRFRIRGTELTDISQLCTDNQILFRGYCIGVIETEGDGICNDAFLSGSYPLAIKSQDIQNLLLENRERLPVAKELVIGLRSDVNGVYSWPDGTPVLYDNFAPFTVAPIGKEKCSFINFFNCFVWELYDCTPSDRSTICQGDLNECLVAGHNCAHNCVNDDGGYHCECRDDFRLRVDFQEHEECEDVCFNSFDAGYLPWVNLRTGTCFHPVIQSGTYEEAVESCQLIYGRLPSLLEVSHLQDFFNITGEFLWAAPPPGFEAPKTNNPLCYAAEFPVVGNISAGLSPCNEILQFACIRDVSNTKIQDLLDDDVRNITLDVSFGYIELRAYSPWYYTGTTISITIVGVPGLQTRIDILNMELRTFNDGVQGNRCLDTLSIYDPTTQGYREICGHLPPFRLIMPPDIVLEISIGELQATMEPLGFSLYYEIVDCRREQCITGCGESSLVYEDGILGTSPFPSTFSPFSECQVRVLGPPDQYIAINFTDYRFKYRLSPQGQPDSEIIRPLNEPDGGGLDACTQIEINSIRSTASWHDIPCLARSSNQFICKVPAISSNADIRSMVSVQPEYINPSSVPNCPTTMITCGTGECVHSVYTCDRHEDCSDGTDERNCPDITSCSSSEFQCEDGECIPISFYCDNMDNCDDGSDEEDCAPYTCNEGQFRCDNGWCIADNLICDLVDHCFDNSDETSCGSSSENIFTCYSGDDHPLSVQCDGIVDCIGSSAEDELSTCEYRQLNHGCKADEIQCNNAACVSRDSQCIYDIDPSAYITGCRDVSHLRLCDDFECPAYFTKCPGSYCIPLRFRCNGVWDCANGEDEMECSSFVCPAGTYSCRRSTICLPPNQVCDGIRHCSDADDEQFCGVTCPVGCNCTGLVFSCDRPTTQEEDPSYVFSPTARKM
nr:uncharacterized protein LOC129267772 [Lytechinus pictus]